MSDKPKKAHLHARLINDDDAFIEITENGGVLYDTNTFITSRKLRSHEEVWGTSEERTKESERRQRRVDMPGVMRFGFVKQKAGEQVSVSFGAPSVREYAEDEKLYVQRGEVRNEKRHHAFADYLIID